MDDITIWRIAATLACLGVFLGILGWTFARRNRAGFEAAAQLPFTGD